MDFDKVREELFKTFKESGMIEAFAKSYAENSGLDQGISNKIVEAKFLKHLTIAQQKFQKIGEAQNPSSKVNSNVDIEEFLNKKTVIKG